MERPGLEVRMGGQDPGTGAPDTGSPRARENHPAADQNTRSWPETQDKTIRNNAPPAAWSEGRGRLAAVTGGAGFLGSHLCDALLASGRRVVCLDDLSTGSLNNIAHLQDAPGFRFVWHDVTRPLPDNLMSFDEIYNLACRASPLHYQADRLHTAKVCALGVLHVLERAHCDGARVLQASTSEVYGDPEVHPQHESYCGHVNPIGPRACYDEGKRFGETLCTDFAAQTGVDVRIVRIFNTYGPRMQVEDGRVVSNFAVQALRGEDITVYGDGSQTRSFCYVDDLVRGFLLAMASPHGVAPVNLGNPNEVTVGQLAELIIALTGSKSRVLHKPLPIDDPRRRKPDIGRAQALLDWAPRVDLQEGLRSTIDNFALRLAQVPSRAAAAALHG